MRKVLLISWSFIKHFYKWHLLLAISMLLISTVFISYDNLSVIGSAGVIEIYGTLLGIILFAPLIYPEQDKGLWELEKSKKTSMVLHYVIRVVCASLTCVIGISVMLILLHMGNSDIYVWKMMAGGVAELLLIGSISYFFSMITNNVIIGYMVSTVYYVINLTNSNLFGKISLFHMKSGDYTFIWIMYLVSIAILIGGTFIREEV